jgi:hypothetical protein
MTTLLTTMKKSSNQPKNNHTAQDFTKEHLRLDVRFEKYENLERMKDCLSFASSDFETLKGSFNEPHPACEALLIDCLDILKSAMCTITQVSIAASVNYSYAKDTFVMAILASQTTIEHCLAKLRPLDADAKKEMHFYLNFLFQISFLGE